MSDDYQNIADLFELDNQEKENKLDEIFQLSMEFIDKYKYIQANGTEREKSDIEDQLQKLRGKISEEAENSRNELNLSKQEVEELANDKSNFSEEQWEMLQKSKSAAKEELRIKREARKSSLSKKTSDMKKPKRKRSKKSSWLKS